MSLPLETVGTFLTHILVFENVLKGLRTVFLIKPQEQPGSPSSPAGHTPPSRKVVPWVLGSPWVPWDDSPYQAACMVPFACGAMADRPHDLSVPGAGAAAGRDSFTLPWGSA